MTSVFYSTKSTDNFNSQPLTKLGTTTMKTTKSNGKLIDINDLGMYFDLTPKDVRILCKQTREMVRGLFEAGRIEWGADDYLGEGTFPLPVRQNPYRWRLSEVKEWYAEMQKRKAFDYFYGALSNSYAMGFWQRGNLYEDIDDDDTAVETFLQSLFEGAEDNWDTDDTIMRPWRYE